jgi:2'-5' RNA ligase
MDPRSNGAESILYALVAYIPNPLGHYLDGLRVQLVPGYDPRAHVTLVPPRPLPGSEQEALSHIQECCRDLSAFEIEVTSVAVFESSKVVYLELGAGREDLIRIHRYLNQGPLYYEEPYLYHPHITLAQDLTAAQVDGKAAQARQIWSRFTSPRYFTVEELVFVRSGGNNHWEDLASIHLLKTPAESVF